MLQAAQIEWPFFMAFLGVMMVIKLVHSFWLEFERFFAEEIELENQNPESAESWHDEDEEARPSSPLELNAIPWGKYDDGGECFDFASCAFC